MSSSTTPYNNSRLPFTWLQHLPCPPESLFLGEDFSLSTTIGSILRELETSMDKMEGPQNPVAPQGLQDEVLRQPDPVFLEALSSWYLGDSGLGDFFLDIDTSAVEKEPVLPPSRTSSQPLLCPRVLEME
ncbi:SERTA domain-containing protein 3 [Sciurus carolinensis]|uniref:SERTA domain-containing protein 3 n=1 Tax=Sciurus carolinensis TaxID=30640 RepID=A0AA41N4M0_SCICA|nr:SERTA domain-containing protein 3 [Sciurus carolinensis]